MAKVANTKNKTITGGSDGSAGFLIPEDRGNKSSELEPETIRTEYQGDQSEKSFKNTRLTADQAQDLIQSVLRGTVATIIDSIGSDPDNEIVNSSISPVSTVSRVIPSPTPLPVSRPVSASAIDDIAIMSASSDNPGSREEGQVDYRAPVINMPVSPSSTTPGIPAVTLVQKPLLEAVIEDTTLKNYGKKQLPPQPGVDTVDSGNSGDINKNISSYEPVVIPAYVPNYHSPEEPTTRICSTCRFYKVIDGDSGYCKAYKFTAKSEFTCDSWTANELSTNGVDSDRVPVVDKMGNPTDDGPVKTDIEDIPDIASMPESIPSKYSHIDFTVSKEMAGNAKKAIVIRASKPESERGMTPVGIARAVQISKREGISPDIWYRMNIYFDRHATDKQNESWNRQDANWQAWNGWGGDAARNRARYIVEQMRDADIAETSECLNVPSGVVHGWYNEKCPPEISEPSIYTYIRDKLRNDATQRREHWCVYDSVKLRKAYQSISNDEGVKEPFVKSSFVKSDILKSIEDEVLGQGGQIKRVKTHMGVMGVDDWLGQYSPALLKQWVDDDWCDIVNKTPDDQYSQTEYYWPEDIFIILLPRSLASAYDNDHRDALIRRYHGFYKSMKVVDCSKMPAELRKLYPECGDNYKPPRVDEQGVAHYRVGYLPEDKDFDSDGDNTNNENDASNQSSSSDASDSGGGAESGSASAGGTGGASGTVASDEKEYKTVKNIKRSNEKKNSGSKKSIKDLDRTIRIVSGPVSEIAGGEIIDNNFEIKRGSDDNRLPSTKPMAYEVVPELSMPHGQRKSVQPLYLPGDRVYSKSFRSLGEVTKSQRVDGENYYTVKLIDQMGIVHGQALAAESDLSPRSMRAIKRIQTKTLRDSVKDNINQIISDIENIIDEHSEYLDNPFDEESLVATLKQVNMVLSNNIFEDASSEMDLRKYVRAMQDVEHTIGGAINLLTTADEYMDVLGDDSSESDMVFEKTQRNILNRLNDCISRSKESLLEDTPMRSYRHRN